MVNKQNELEMIRRFANMKKRSGFQIMKRLIVELKPLKRQLWQ